MKVFKYMLIILSLLFVSCNLGTITKQEEIQDEDKSGGVGIEAHIYIPNWNAPKVVESRVVDPYSTTVELYVFGNGTPVDTISFVPSGGVEVLNFTGLEAGTYNPGDLEIVIYDGSYNPLTAGENLEGVTLTPVGSNAIVFSSTPFNPINVYVGNSPVPQSLVEDDHVFMALDVVADEIYELVYVRTSMTGDVDLYLYDEFGRTITSDVIFEGQNDPQTLTFVPESSGTYYLAFHAFMGEGDVSFTYDLNFSPDNGSLALSGTIHFPPASAGTPVFIKATHSYSETIVLEKEIARDGDTALDFVVSGIPEDTHVSLFVVVDNDSSSHVGYVTGSQGDFTGHYGEESGYNHLNDVDIYLDEIFGVYGTVSFPDWVPDYTPMYIAKVYENGALTGSFGGFSVDSDTGPWINDSFNTIAHPGTYRLLYIADLDNSGLGDSLSENNFYDIVTYGDYYYVSEEFTVTDSNVTISNGTAYTASIITGTVILPEQEDFFYYRIYADDNTDVSDGVISTNYGSYLDFGVFTNSIDYSLVIPEGSNLYISAHVYFGYYYDDLTPDDYYSFLDENNPGYYTNGDIVPLLYVGGHINRLTGTFQLPEGVYADGNQFVVGNITQDIWIDDVVPNGTGLGGSFEYSLEGFELGEDQEITLVIDMDGNSLMYSPNAGDVVGYFEAVTLDNPFNQSLNFVDTFIADPTVFGTAYFPEYLSNKNYQIWLDGEPEVDGNVTGSSMDYDLLFVESGTRSVTFIVDNNEDGIFGNSGDLLGRTDVYVEDYDTTAPDITLEELGIVVEGEITIPEDLGINVHIYIVLESTTGGVNYEYYEFVLPDDDMYSDSFKYRFENVLEDVYNLFIFTDFNDSSSPDMGEYLAYYPFGMMYDLEDIYIYQDIYELNFIVDPSATY